MACLFPQLLAHVRLSSPVLEKAWASEWDMVRTDKVLAFGLAEHKLVLKLSSPAIPADLDRAMAADEPADCLNDAVL
jgi:hypothetical protein